MSCAVCQDGLIPFVPSGNPKADAEIGAADLCFAVCLCASGQAMWSRENHHRTVAPLWRAWCAKHQVEPSRVYMVEDVYTPAELSAAGLMGKPSELSREAALLAHGRKR